MSKTKTKTKQGPRQRTGPRKRTGPRQRLGRRQRSGTRQRPRQKLGERQSPGLRQMQTVANAVTLEFWQGQFILWMSSPSKCRVSSNYIGIKALCSWRLMLPSVTREDPVRGMGRVVLWTCWAKFYILELCWGCKILVCPLGFIEGFHQWLKVGCLFMHSDLGAEVNPREVKSFKDERMSSLVGKLQPSTK